MKIQIDIPDNVELVAKAVNNAAAAYHWMIASAVLHCELPTKFEKLKAENESELFEQLGILKSIVHQLDDLQDSK